MPHVLLLTDTTMQKLSIVAALVAAPLCAQQGNTLTNGATTPNAVPAAYSAYGTGCAGSGWPSGTNHVVPAAQAAAFGNNNNNIPYSWTPARYLQVFLGSELPAGPTPIIGLGLRQDDSFSGFTAHKVDMALWIGGTTFDHNTITATFDNNFNVSAQPKTLVFRQREYSFPQMPPSNPTNPADFFVNIPFDAPYVMNVGSDNVVVETANYGNTNGNAVFTYPLDAHSGATTTRLYALGTPTAASGTLGIGYGLVYAFRQIGATPAIPTITNSNTPLLGGSFHYELLHSARNAPTGLIIGASNTMSGSIPLPFNMAPIGAPGCFLLASTDVILGMLTGPGGDLANTLPVPNNIALDGQSLYIQHFIIDPGTNPLGITTSNAGQLTLGTT